jgi:hypothetical protein
MSSADLSWFTHDRHGLFPVIELFLKEKKED